jgi:protein O-GlcNAc transferase
LYPDQVDARISKGVILESRGQLDSAIEQYRKALALAPRSAAASQNLGSALQKKGQTQEAVSILQAGVQANPRDSDLRAAYGSALLAAGHPADAERELQTSLSSRPDNSSVLYNLADAQRKLGKSPEALANLKRAYELAPTDADINLSLGSLLVESGNPTEASPYLQAIRRSGKYDSQAFYAVAVALAAKPDFPLAIALQTNLFIEQGHLQEAAACLNPALGAHADSAELQNSAGLLTLARSNGKSAESYFTRGLALKPDFTDAAVNHAIA